MNPDKQIFLNLRAKPARLGALEAAWFLGFNLHDIPILVAARLMKPLGTPAPNSPKYFAECELETLKKDRDWLSRATKATSNHWKQKNRHNSRITDLAPPDQL
ncbi:hypothetical protein [Verrucomicrobium sp. GAS474]|uniref:hypothetical protein n=1 Tax=Verrucomicrobium sp. GAS474 TaxID=1882831 RepID=UPI0012FF8A4E|nr:hypothetical protein [Verrucomicrobium sp. GAS474]